jgi:hypothetical protein
MANTRPWTCPACSSTASSRYCAVCGEERPQPHELTLRGLLRQAMVACTSLDARLLRTSSTLLRQPGALTAYYLQGRRKAFIGPFAFFLLANVLFVAMEALTSSNIFSSPLNKHLHNQPWSELAQRLVAQRLLATHISLEAYAPVFNQAVAAHAKSLVALLVIPFALLPPLLFHRQRLPFAAHLAFSLHFYAFMLFLISAALLIPWFSVLSGGPGLSSQLLDNSIAVGLLALCTLYLYLATRRVYHGRGAVGAVKLAILVLAATGIFLGYRFLLLLMTLYGT